jgi:ABC-type transport system involved in multi-copper enzyme maturation permease subunit
MFWNLLQLESDKLFKRRLPWIGLVIALLPMIVFFILGQATTSTKTYWTWPGGLITSLAFANGYSPGYGYATYLLAVIVGVSLAQEYSWRTLHLWLSHGVPRPLLLLAKCLLALVTVLLVTLAFLLIGGLLSVILSLVTQQSASGVSLNAGTLLLSCLRTCYGILPYAALAFLLVVLSRSAAVAIAGVILFMLALELPLTGILPLLNKNLSLVGQLLPAGLAQSMNGQNYAAAHIAMPTLVSSGQISPGVAALLIALYTVVLIALSFWLFLRQDLTN